MIVEITNYGLQNIIFFCLLGLAIFLTFRKRKNPQPMDTETTTELKGLAILAIVLAHIGYALVSDNHFLAPLSNWAGVGVDLFFFLSGFGLTMSALKKGLSIAQFYIKRLSKVYWPIWISLFLFLLLDKIFLGIGYSWPNIIKSFLGFFPRADLYADINSPLWFITPLVFYYLLFPLVFIKKFPEVSAVIMVGFGFLALKYNWKIDVGVRALWTLHYIAFPAGVFFAGLLSRLQKVNLTWFSTVVINKKKLLVTLKYLSLLVLLGVWWYLFNHSGVGEGKLKAQLLSLAALLITLGIFILKPIKNQFLFLLGTFSFEIYLWHWPIMYRYDFLYRFLPAGIATFLYLVVFLGLGWGFKKISANILTKKYVGN